MFCVRGFWGIRQGVEQLLALSGDEEDAVERVIPSKHEGAIRLLIGVEDDTVTPLRDYLQKHIPPGVLADVGGGEEILDILWTAASRPAVLVLLTHLESAQKPGEPSDPRLVLTPRQKWLLARQITTRHQRDGAWEPPQSVVLLMACGTAATDIGTLNDFVISLTAAEAGAIIGTETPLFAALAARFAEEVTSELWNGRPLGTAVVGFRRRLLAEFNPLGFLFSAYGDSDLCIAP